MKPFVFSQYSCSFKWHYINVASSRDATAAFSNGSFFVLAVALIHAYSTQITVAQLNVTRSKVTLGHVDYGQLFLQASKKCLNEERQLLYYCVHARNNACFKFNRCTEFNVAFSANCIFVYFCSVNLCKFVM
jgi:hypothetical protein